MKPNSVRLRLTWAFLALTPLLSAADPIAPGVENFHQVSDSVYRGAQPSEAGFLSLSKLGIKTVLDLRAGDRENAGEKQMVEKYGMHYVSIPMHGMNKPNDDQIAQALVLLEATGSAPVFIHCKRGADRTGTVVAVYRMYHDKWTNEKALAEAKQYGMSPFQRAMMHYILRYHVTPLLGNGDMGREAIIAPAPSAAQANPAAAGPGNKPTAQ